MVVSASTGMNLYGADLLSTSMVLIYLWLFDICGYFAIFTYLDVKRSEDNMQLAEVPESGRLFYCKSRLILIREYYTDNPA
tara:strand:+ start:208 stop:450 length:243 start_codon:yes stop_codon:yes gene_type:complete